MNILSSFEEDMTYEVLVSTQNRDGSLNIKPFGLKIKKGIFFFSLFPNETLLNIKRMKKLTVYFTQDILLFTKSLTSTITRDELLEVINYEVETKLLDIDENLVEDDYGKNITTTILLEPIKIIEYKKTLPIINRASNHIMELLVDFSRYDFMDADTKTDFMEKVHISEKIIKKTGNKKHWDSLNLIKKSIK